MLLMQINSTWISFKSAVAVKIYAAIYTDFGRYGDAL